MDDESVTKAYVSISTAQLFSVYTANDQAVDPGGKVLHQYIKSALLNALHTGTPHEALSSEILGTLSRLVCAGKDPQTELPRLKQALGSAGPCGKILQYNEPTFSCLECALDRTCVMCMECYYASPHHSENHNLHVTTSHGSGMCDCGDNEAWKYGPACSVHAGKGDDDSIALEMKLPGTVRNICTIIFKTLLDLAMSAFIEKGESYDEQFDIPHSVLPNETDCIDVSTRYVTVIYNDEVHNFDEVIAQFKQLLMSSHSEASAYATSIDREGRMLIRAAEKTDCQELTRQFLNYKPGENSRIRFNKEPLVTKSMPEFVYLLQNIMVDVVDWITELSRGNAALKRIACNVSFKGENDGNCFIEKVMLHERFFWKKVKNAWNNLFMSAYFGDVLYKKDIGVLFIKNYSAVFRSFLEDDKVREFPYCLISLTVQLFTVPSISNILMTEHNALEVIFRQFIDFYEMFVVQDSGISKFQNLQSNATISKRRMRLNHVLLDAKYILSNIPEEISAATEDAFLVFLQLFVEFISYMQEMNPHVRESGNHILREREWDQYFLLEISEIRQIMSFVARWCTASPRLFVKSLEVLLKAQLENSEKFELSEPSVVNSARSLCSLVRSLGGGPNTATWEQQHRQLAEQPLFPHRISYVQHDMFKDPVSFHIPATRLFAIVFSHFPKFDLPIDLLLKTFTPEELLDLPLRTILLSQQIEASMWKRNGTTMENQSMCYRDHYKSIMWDKDLLAVQLLLTLCKPEDALLKIIQKYKIEPYLVLLKSDTNYDHLLRMAEAFSSLLLYVICERFRLNVSEAKEGDIIRKDAVHILAISNVPRSKIIKTLESNFDHFEEDITKTDEIDEILDEIADKIPVEDGVKTMLKLKPQFYSWFTPFYYHYSHGQRQSAESSYYQRQANSNEGFKPPPLPAFTKLTKKLRNYLISPVIQRFIYAVLKRFTSNNCVLVSDLLLHQILYLTMFGLLDELNTPDDPLPTNFTHCLTRPDNPSYLIPEDDQCSIFSLLKCLLSMEVKSVNEVKPLVRWILKTCDSLTNTSSETDEGATEMEIDEQPKASQETHKEKMRKRREQMMRNFKSQQAKFMQENQEAFNNMTDDAEKGEELEENTENIEHIVCGPNKGPIPRPENTVLTCILCKDCEKVNSGYSTMMYGCLIEKSVVLKTEKDNEIPDDYRLSYLLGGQNLHIQSCGHPMHLKCLQSIMKLTPALQHLLTMTGADRNRYSFFLPKGEFSCPYCKMAANCALPVVGYETRDSQRKSRSTQDFIKNMESGLDQNEIELMELEFSESPTTRTPPPPTIEVLDTFTDAQNFMELLRDTMLQERLTRMSEELPPAETPASENVEPSSKFKEDMRRFYRRAKNILDQDAVGSRCYAPFTLKMISYTFSMLEHTLRDKPLLAGLAEYQEGFFESFLQSVHQSLSVHDHLFNQELDRELRYIFSSQVSEGVKLPSILNTDIFTVFVATRFVIYCNYECFDSALVELCVIAQIIKILLSVSPGEIVGADSSADDSDAIHLATVWGHVRHLCRLSDTDDPFQCPTYLLSRVQQELLPLLRKMALFLRYATQVPGGAALKEIQSPQGEFHLLMRYLNLPALGHLLTFDRVSEIGDYKDELIQKWCQSLNRDKFLATLEKNKGKREAKLIDLPKNFVDLLVKASKYTCPKITFGKIQTTAICLICGDLVCYQSYCCQETIGDSNFGPCNMHAHRCSGDLGVFLTLEKCQVLFLPLRTQGYFISGPYVDKYGEGYKTYTKNKALTLSPQIYRKIELMWVRHEIRPLVARNSEGLGYSRIEQIGLMY